MDKSLLDAIPVPAFLVSEDDTLVQANQLFLKLFPRAEIGRPYVSVLRQPGLDGLLSATRQGELGRSVELRIRTGTEQYFKATCAPLEGGGHLVCLQDVNETATAIQMRRDFISDLSHELRTPLTAMRGILDNADGDPEALGVFTPILSKEVDRMSRLVTDLLMLGKVQANARRRPKQTISLQTIINGAVDPLRAVAKSLGTTVTVEMPKVDLRLRGDADEMTQAISNLVTNAIRYGPSGSEVRVLLGVQSANAGRGAAIIDVIDQGEGVGLHHIPRLTERFYRVDSHRSRDMGGSGLGLAIVKHVVTHHRGKLQFSNPPGGGFQVRITLPLSASKQG